MSRISLPRLMGCLERNYPIALASAGAAIYLAVPLFRHYAFEPDACNALFAAMVSVSGIAAGFLATTKSIFFAIGERRVMRLLRNANLFERLVDYQLVAVNLSFLLAFASAAMLLIELHPWSRWSSCIFGVWLFIAIWASTTCYRVVRLLGLVLRYPETPPI